MKICKSCDKKLPLSKFHHNWKMVDGHLNHCKDCVRPILKNNQVRNYKLYKDKFGLGSGTIKRYGFRLSLKVYEKAKRMCETCGNRFDLTIHHKDHRGRNFVNNSLKPNNSINNLKVLCRSCHGRIHGAEKGKTGGILRLVP